MEDKDTMEETTSIYEPEFNGRCKKLEIANSNRKKKVVELMEDKDTMEETTSIYEPEFDGSCKKLEIANSNRKKKVVELMEDKDTMEETTSIYEPEFDGSCKKLEIANSNRKKKVVELMEDKDTMEETTSIYEPEFNGRCKKLEIANSNRKKKVVELMEDKDTMEETTSIYEPEFDGSCKKLEIANSNRKKKVVELMEDKDTMEETTSIYEPEFDGRCKKLEIANSNRKKKVVELMEDKDTMEETTSIYEPEFDGSCKKLEIANSNRKKKVVELMEDKDTMEETTSIYEPEFDGGCKKLELANSNRKKKVVELMEDKDTMEETTSIYEPEFDGRGGSCKKLELANSTREEKGYGSTKKNWCFYCDTLQTKIMRHMSIKHPNEDDVRRYLSIKDPDLKKQKKLRKEVCSVIINKSNKIFNEKITNNTAIGDLIPTKKPKEQISTLSHVLCSDCGGLLSKRFFWSHKKTCNKRTVSLGIKAMPKSVSLKKKIKKYELLEELILENMKRDQITWTVRNDYLILEFGRRFLKSHRSPKQRHYVANKMRSLATLLIKMKQKTVNNKTENKVIETMEDVLDPTNFDLLCETVNDWSRYDEKTGECLTGSVPRRLCKVLKATSQIIWSEALKDSTKTEEDKSKAKSRHEIFLNLMSSDWPSEVNSISDKSLKSQKVMKHDKMPCLEDITLFLNEMTNILHRTTLELKENPSVKEYNTLCTAIIAYLIVFNGRRPSEVTYATMENFSCIKISSSNSNRMGVFSVAATKNDVKVPIIVSDPALKAIETLISYREIFKIPGNILLAKTDGLAYVGGEVLSKFKAKISLQKPDDFTANGIRHYLATNSQTNPILKQYMPKFLGHTSSTHKKFYEMQMDEVNLNIIAPEILKQCGHSVDLCNKTTQELSTGKSLKKKITTSHKQNTQEKQNKTVGNIQEIPNTSRNLRPRIITATVQNDESYSPVSSPDIFSDNTSEDPNFDVNIDEVSAAKPKSLKRTHPCSLALDPDSPSRSSDSTSDGIDIQTRNRWITPEKQELFAKLPKTMLGIEQAGRGKIKEVWEKSDVIKTRHSLQMTRIEVSKYYTKKKKVPTPVKKKLIDLIDNNNEL